MNCQDALDLLYDIIDKEANEIDSQEVKTHLENCRECFERFQVEESIQDFLNEKIKLTANKTVNSDRLENLKKNIIVQLDNVDSEQNGGETSRFFNMSAKILVAAASLVIIIGVAFLSADLYRHNDKYQPIEDAHMTAVENVANYKNNPANLNSDVRLAEKILGYSLLGVKEKNVLGYPMSHAVYEKDGDMISVFVVSIDNFQIPDDIANTRVEHNNIVFYEHQCPHCRLLFHAVGNLIYITASSNEKFDLFQFLPNQTVI